MSLVGGPAKPLISPAFIFNKKVARKAIHDRTPNSQVLALLELLYSSALEINMCRINENTDLELEARLGPVARTVIED